MSLLDPGPSHTTYLNLDELPDIDEEDQSDSYLATHIMLNDAEAPQARRVAKQREGAPDSDEVLASRMHADEARRAMQVGYDRARAHQLRDTSVILMPEPAYYEHHQLKTDENSNFRRYYAPPEETSSPSIIGTLFTIASNLLAGSPPRKITRAADFTPNRSWRNRLHHDGTQQRQSVSPSNEDISLYDERTDNVPLQHQNGHDPLPISPQLEAIEPVSRHFHFSTDFSSNTHDVATYPLHRDFTAKRNALHGKQPVKRPRRPFPIKSNLSRLTPPSRLKLPPLNRPKPTPARADRATFDLCRKAGWRRCPGCGHMVERAGGCMRLRCRCGTTWCYKCGVKVGWLWGCACRGEDTASLEVSERSMPAVDGAQNEGVAEREPRMPGALPWDENDEEEVGGIPATLEGRADEVEEVDASALEAFMENEVESTSDWDEIDGFWDEPGTLASEDEVRNGVITPEPLAEGQTLFEELNGDEDQNEGDDVLLEPDTQEQHDYLLTPGAYNSLDTQRRGLAARDRSSHGMGSADFLQSPSIQPPSHSLEAHDSVKPNTDPRSPLHPTPRHSKFLEAMPAFVKPPLRVTTSSPPAINTPPAQRPTTPNILDEPDDQEVMNRVRRAARARAIVESPIYPEAERVKARARMSMDEGMGVGSPARRKMGRRSTTGVVGGVDDGIARLSLQEETGNDRGTAKDRHVVLEDDGAGDDDEELEPVFALPFRITPERTPSGEWARATLMQQTCMHAAGWKRKEGGGRCLRCDGDLEGVRLGDDGDEGGTDDGGGGAAWVCEQCNAVMCSRCKDGELAPSGSGQSQEPQDDRNT